MRLAAVEQKKPNKYVRKIYQKGRCDGKEWYVLRNEGPRILIQSSLLCRKLKDQVDTNVVPSSECWSNLPALLLQRHYSSRQRADHAHSSLARCTVAECCSLIITMLHWLCAVCKISKYSDKSWYCYVSLYFHI